MKQKIILILLLVSLVLIVFLASTGLTIGKFQILSIAQLMEKNASINEEIDKVSQITSVEYPSEIKTLESTMDSLTVEKEKYEQLSGFSEEEEKTYTTEKFDLDYLWATIGKFATKKKIDLSMEIKKASGTGYYDLDFVISGEYTDIIDFVKKLENDSELNFRIYNFKIDSASATFTVKDVNINDEKLVINQSAQEETEKEEKNQENTDNSTVEQVEEMPQEEAQNQ